MKLDPIFAHRQYDAIRKVYKKSAPVFDKLVGKDRVCMLSSEQSLIRCQLMLLTLNLGKKRYSMY